METPWIPAKVRDASDRNYSRAVLSLLDQAEKEITISLYLFEPDDSASSEHPVNRFAEALLKARGRRVQIRIILNTNFRFRPKSGVGQGRYFERLMESGVQVSTLLPGRRLHDKLIVIDRRYVVDGSMNWSVAALMSNFESAVILDSPALAKIKLARIEKWMQPTSPDEKRRDVPLMPVPQTIEIPLALFEKKVLPRMVRTSDMRALDLYLTLLGQSAARNASEFSADLETLGRGLGLPKDWDRSRVRRQMIKVLKKLEKKYALLEAEFPFGRDVRITLKKFPGETIQVPGYLLDAGYLAQASSGSELMALAGEVLKREGAAIEKFSAPQLQKRFGVNASTFVRARRALKGK